MRSEEWLERRRVYRRRYHQEHKEQLNEAYRKYRQKRKLETLAKYSMSGVPRCNWCGIEDIDVLCLDHINDNGAQHKREEKYSDIHTWLRTNNYPEGFQVLCYNCNMKKRFIRERNDRERTSTVTSELPSRI